LPDDPATISCVCEAASQITNELPKFPDGSPDRAGSLANLRNIRRALRGGTFRYERNEKRRQASLAGLKTLDSSENRDADCHR
jgi:hypothetical protein